MIVIDRRYLDSFLQTIKCLVRDKSISVRACVASTLLGVAFHDEQLALELFDTLSETDDVLLATDSAEEFICCCLVKHLAVTHPYIQRMLHSERAQVRQAGARLATLARLYHKDTDLAAVALSGDAVSRLGVAEVAEHNFTHPECREWCEETLCVLFDDADATVRRKSARCFWHLWRKPEIPLAEYHSLIARS